MRSLNWNDIVILKTHLNPGKYKRGSGTTWEEAISSQPAAVMDLGSRFTDDLFEPHTERDVLRLGCQIMRLENVLLNWDPFRDL